MLLSADSLMIIFVKIYCYWTRTVGVIAKGSRGPVFFETQCISDYKLVECPRNQHGKVLAKKPLKAKLFLQWNPSIGETLDQVRFSCKRIC